MEIKKDITIRESLKQLSMQDFMYPGIIFAILIIIIVLFFLATQSISKKINIIFSTIKPEEIKALNLEHYKLIAGKLGIPVNIDAPEVSLPKASTTTTFDKNSFTILIKNSTSKKGAATELSKKLESYGYASARTGNEVIRFATTTLFVKNSKFEYVPIFLEDLQKTYPEIAIASTTNEIGPDFTIIIGTK